MSLSYQPLQPVLVKTNVSNITNERKFAVIKGGSQTTYKVYNSSNISQSSITFTCPPPSAKIITSRKVLCTIPVRLTFTGNINSGTVGVTTLLQNLRDAPRAYPIQGSIDTLQATINNYSVSINSADVIHAMSRFNLGHELRSMDFSMTPTYPDQSQSYDDLFGGILNPLGNVGDCLDDAGLIMPRGGFPFVIVSNPPATTIPQIGVTAVVDCLFSEYLFLSPFYWGHGNESGFYNITSMDYNLTFLGQAANRMWSHSNAGGAVITSSNFVFGGLPNGPTSFPGVVPSLQFEYITPLETTIIPNNIPITYSYYDVIRFPTDQNFTAAGAANTFSSNNIQINSIPSRIYVYMQEKNSDKYATPTSTDTYFSIDNISIQFKNKNGLLASASQQQLYQLSVAAGCKMSWASWYGQHGRALGTFAPGNNIGLAGSVVAIDFPEAIGLDSLEAVGVLSQSQLQINVHATNISNRTINPTLWIIVVLAGTFTIQGSNQCTAQIGVISPNDILDAQEQSGITYDSIKGHEGGDFLSGLKSFGNTVLNYLKDFNEYAKKNKLISKGLSVLPQTKFLAPAARLLGYGEGEDGCDGEGVNIGGRRRASRRKRGGLGNYDYVLGDGEVGGGRVLDRMSMMDRLKY